jgi:hypothetical protein
VKGVVPPTSPLKKQLTFDETEKGPGVIRCHRFLPSDLGSGTTFLVLTFLVLEKNRKTISRFNTENVSNSSFF